MSAVPAAAAEHYREGLRLHAAGDLAGAVNRLQTALKAGGEHPAVLEALARVAFDGRDYRSAEQISRHLRAKGATPALDTLLARALYQQQKFAEAARLLEPLVASAPGNTGLAGMLASALECTGEFDRSLTLERASFSREPNAARAVSLASALFRQARYDELAAELPALLARFPGEAQLLATAAVLALGLGDFEAGIARMQRRQELLGVKHVDARVSALPVWDGVPFAGTLLVTLEPMIGDEIIMSSLLRALVAMQQRCVVEVDARALPLYRRSFPTLEFVSLADKVFPARLLKPGDFRRVATIELMHALQRRWTLPGTAGWLRPDPDLVASKRSEYTARWPGKRLVGISWRSRQYINEMDLKSVPLAALAQTLAMPDTVFINVQYGEVQAEVDALPAPLRPWRDAEIDPFRQIDALAAQLAAFDRVISVSNVTAHVSGSVGVPTTVLLPKRFPVLWHWGLRGEETTWYGSVRLLRNTQEQGQGWAAMDAALAADAAGLLAGPDTRLAR